MANVLLLLRAAACLRAQALKREGEREGEVFCTVCLFADLDGRVFLQSKREKNNSLYVTSRQAGAVVFPCKQFENR
jgi:hypothetical protein